MAIQKEKLSDGTIKYVVRVKRYGKRAVLLRTANPYAAIHVELEQYKKYLERTVLRGKAKSRGDHGRQK